MARTTRPLRRLRDLLAWQVRDREIDEEMQYHIESLARQYAQGGMSEAEARAAARRQFGSLLQMKERGHDVRGAGALEAAGREMRHALRRLLHAPAFTATAVVTLALAIGANAAIFSVVQRVVLDPLPYPQSDRLVQIEHAIPRINAPSGIGMTAGLYYQYRAAPALDAVAMYRPAELTLAGGGEPERIRILWTTPSLGQVLRVPPVAGRWFTDHEGTPGAPQAVVLSHGLWMRRFAGNPAVVGTAISLDGSPANVVGIMPASFAFPDPTIAAWLADRISPAGGFGLPFSSRGVARLRDGATIADARAVLDAVIARLPDLFPGDPGVLGNLGPGGLRSAPRPLKDATIGNVARTLWILLAAVGVVLLVACANVANLFLVRSDSRQREVAVRRALGASGPRIARFFFAESTLLSIGGAAGGLALAWGGAGLLRAFGPATLPRLHEIHLDGRTAMFTVLLGVVVALAFGSIPLWRAAPLALSLHELGRTTTASARRHRARHLLMGAQVALALVLLIASGLMVRSFLELRAFDPGFEPASALTFRVGLPERAYPTREAVVAAHHAMLRELSAIPGVIAVSASTGLPLEPVCFGNSIRMQGRPTADRTAPPIAVFCAVAGDYVDAMGLRLRRGRTLEAEDIERGRADVLVNQAFVDRLFPNDNPLGQRIRSNAPPTSAPRPDGNGDLTWDGAPPWLTVVGVVSNTPLRALAEPNPIAVVYMPASLAGGPDIPPIAMLGPSVSTLSYVVRTSGSPLAVVSPVRRAVDAVDPNLAVADVRSLEDVVARGAAQLAFAMVLLTIAAATAVALGVTGIVGVISYIVGQRTNEIGVRLALGAAPGEVAFAVARQGVVVAAAGAAVGLAAALAGGRLIESLLYAVGPRDPVVFGATTVALLAIALAACWWPARRAAGINPLDALRVE